MSTGRPAKCTGMMARVLAVIAAAASSTSRLRVYRSMSTKTGLARTRATTFALAAKLMAGTMTSSPSPTSATSSAISRPAVAEVITRTWRPNPK